jgi:undecaprenyl-diphosphatase
LREEEDKSVHQTGNNRHQMLHTILSLDKSLFLFLNRDIANPVFDFVFPLITERNFWIIPGAIALILFVLKERKRALIATGLALITVAITDPLCCRIIKEIVQRHRPCDPCCLVDGGRFLLGNKGSLSFPSAHAMNMFGEAMLFSLLYRRRAVWFFTFACLIGFSRIYVGVHYPLDVLGGALFGTLVGAGVYWAYASAASWMRRRREKDHGTSASEPGDTKAKKTVGT